jgi:Cu+-exporting ATPase
MHREISHADHGFSQESNLSLYLLTGLLGLLIGLDLWPAFAAWATDKGLPLPFWSREFYPGYRIALIAAVLGGARVLYGSLEGLLEGRIGADLALAIACVAAILFRKPLVAAEVVFIGMVGECLESFTFERTQRAIRRIVEVCPRRCWLLRDGREVRVLTSEVRVGDRVVVKPGARIPVDGVVIDGRSAVDTSALTGESLPVDRAPGDDVLAGTLNQFGALVIEARRVADQTVVGRVIELTARALKDKASLERTADRLARYFLPVVLGLAALTFLVGLLLHTGVFSSTKRSFVEAMALSIDPTLAVLVVACPCALILATPAAIIAALGRLAGTGVLIKGGTSIERLAEVSAFAFDKTGTLTEGRLELGDLAALNDVSADELLRIAATAEQRSEHPLARLITQEAAARHLALDPIDEFQSHPGAGVMVQTSTGAIVVGSRRLLEERGVILSPETVRRLEPLEATGQTLLLVARAGQVLGVIGARDRVRPEASGILAELRALGISDIALLTGDRPAVAQALASALAIPEVHADLLPQQKAEFIERWRQELPVTAPPLSHQQIPLTAQPRPLRRVAMVGDGINDAPALACADVGLAIGGTGTDIAAEAGDVVLMGDPLRTLPLLVRLSRETVRIIRQNILIFAFGVNAVGIVLTAWLWPLLATSPEWYEQAPLAGVVYHQLGSLAVLLNAMRLLWFERPAASAGWQGARETLRKVDRWLEQHLDFHEGMHWLEHHLRPIAWLLVLLAGVVYGLSGLTAIGPDEVGVVRRFGRPLTPELEPGLSWCWPWPIDTVTRVQPDRIRTVEVGFRSAPGAAVPADGLSWSSAHGGTGFLRIPDESVMITGDGNLVELQASVRYAIDRKKLSHFLFEIRDADEIIRATAESVLRETVAGRPFLELLSSARAQFQSDVLARLQERCASYGADGLGVRLDGLSLHDLHPPQDVVPAYHRVTEAMESRDRRVNEAIAKTIRIPARGDDSLPGPAAARVKQEQILNQAAAETHEQVKMAEAYRSQFLARLQARTTLSGAQEWQLFLSALDAIRGGQSMAAAYREYERHRQQLLTTQAALTDFRLFWDSLSAALSGREKVLIDADKVPGRRHLLLFDPDQFRIPVPMLMQPGRGSMPARGPRIETPDEGP